MCNRDPIPHMLCLSTERRLIFQREYFGVNTCDRVGLLLQRISMKFRLRNIEVPINLGVTETERSQKQTILVSLAWRLRADKAAQSDDVNDTVDYFQIQQLIKNFPQGQQWHLLEKLHHDLLEAIENHFPELDEVTLTIEKFPFLDGSVTVSNQ